jgi:hypothetical protein
MNKREIMVVESLLTDYKIEKSFLSPDHKILLAIETLLEYYTNKEDWDELNLSEILDKRNPHV